jgi:Reverse transcriptase (RNA-dependent DNA polymerase)
LIPRGIKVESDEECALKVKWNLYGQKQAGRVWNLHMVRKRIKFGFQQSEVDECLFYKGNAMYVLYTDDSIFAGPDVGKLDKIIQEIVAAGLEG